ncbi:MAG: GNAT family N-acetyltransferase [Thaumarchaeota archaeon]|nr:MAG: GNAT family N-acetyltransferase [Nitrososphaerota archaeon]
MHNAILEVKVREFRHSDYDSHATIRNALDPTTHSSLRAKYEDSCFGRTRYRMKRYVAESDRGEIVGVGGFEHLFFSYQPHRFALSVELHPAWQRRGIGGLLYERLESELRSAGAEAWALVDSTQARASRSSRRGGLSRREEYWNQRWT